MAMHGVNYSSTRVCSVGGRCRAHLSVGRSDRRAHPSAEHVAHWIQEQLTPYSRYLGLRAGLVDRSAEFSWIAAVDQLQEILG